VCTSCTMLSMIALSKRQQNIYVFYKRISFRCRYIQDWVHLWIYELGSILVQMTSKEQYGVLDLF